MLTESEIQSERKAFENWCLEKYKRHYGSCLLLYPNENKAREQFFREFRDFEKGWLARAELEKNKDSLLKNAVLKADKELQKKGFSSIFDSKAISNNPLSDETLEVVRKLKKNKRKVKGHEV